MTPSPQDSATRNRSNSGEDGGLPEHDRKRPRLSEGTSDAEQHLPDLNSTTSHPTAYSGSISMSPDPSPKSTLPPRSPEVNMGTSSPTSKVTINTRPLSSQSMFNNVHPSGDGPVDDTDDNEESQTTTIPSRVTPSPETTIPNPPDTISISSSPVGSPEIEIAEVEDYDQDPSRTKWTRRVGGSGNARVIQPLHVYHTFPLADTFNPGEGRLAITQLVKLFGDASRHPGSVFDLVKDWFIAFANSCDDLTEGIVDEDPVFWARLPLIPEAVLKRDQQTATSVDGQDLIDFLVAYGHITKLMFQLDTRRCTDFVANGESLDKVLRGSSWSYLTSLTYIFSKDCVLLNSLQKYHDLDPILIIKPCCCHIMDVQGLDLMSAVGELAFALPGALVKSPKFFKDFSSITVSLNAMFGIVFVQPGNGADSDSEMTNSVQSVQSGLKKTLSGLDKLLQDSIRKQCAWLTMDVGMDIVNKLSPMIAKLGAEFPEYGISIIAAAGLAVEDSDFSHLDGICLFAWKFMVYHRFLRHGRMELRVCGVERMCHDLVQVFTCHIRDKVDGHEDPVVTFLNRFLRKTNIIEYVIGVDSHPQIIQRSANLVGFLNVSRTYTTADTNLIWKAVTDGQDPRTVQEVLSLIQRCFETFYDMEVVIDLCQKLVDLPLYRFDLRLLEFSIAALELIRAKTPHNSLSQYFHAPQIYDPVSRKLTFRLLRIVSAPSLPSDSWFGYQTVFLQFVQSFLQPSREPGRCLSMSEEEEQAILSEIRLDLETHSPASCGSILILNHLLNLPPQMFIFEAKVSIVERSSFLNGIVDDIALLSERYGAEPSYESVQQFDARLVGLSNLLTLVPEKFDDDILNSLWTSLLTRQTLAHQHRNVAWGKLTSIMKRCRQPNHAIDRILQDYWPRLQPVFFSKEVLEFAEQSITYEAETIDQDMVASDEVVVIPGIERVWTIMLDAPPGTLETEATDFVINQYLRNPSIRKATKSSVNATHLALIDRCVNLVLGSASRLKSFTEDENAGDGSGNMTIIASLDEIRVEESRFDRSLLFLRRFTEAVKGNPGCSPISQRQADVLPEFPGKNGDNMTFIVQVFGNKYVTDAQRRVTVGSGNTGAELWTYLSNISGFSSFTVINHGKRRDLDDMRNTSLTLQELDLIAGSLFVQKDEQTVESQPSTRLRLSSPVDEKIILHFDDLYNLLESDDRLAKEVYDFLNITTVREKVSQLARGMQTPAAELLSSSRPYKLLFCTQALRSPVEEESFSKAPDAPFLAYAVDAVVSAFINLVQDGYQDGLQMAVAYELLDTLMLAFRAKVPSEASRLYLSGHEHFPALILHYFEEVLKGTTPHLEYDKMIRVSFEVLLEAQLQNDSSWKPLNAHSRFSDLLGRALLSDARHAVRTSVLDALLGLTGAGVLKSSTKITDPRAPRSRYETSTIESCLLNVWDLLLDIVPKTEEHTIQCQEFFDSVLAVLRRVGKPLGTPSLQVLFAQWTDALAEHDTAEIVGQPRRDRFVLGITKVILECVRLLRVREALPSQSKLMRKIITKFLFPPLSQPDSDVLSITPILDSEVRDGLYELLVRMCQTPAEVHFMALELSDDLISTDMFESGISHERLALRTEVGYAGLRNLSNTCYLNSLWSQLFMNVQFRELLLNAAIIDEKQQRLLWEFGKVFAHMQNSYDKSVEPSGAVGSIVTYDGDNIDVTVQMDVDEFFNLLFDRLETQILDANARSTFKSFYGGQTIQQIKSKECEHVSERPEAFAVLPVEIKEKFRLEDSLKAYVEGELLQGDNKYSCTACGRLVDAVKRSCLKEVPDHLIFNLKRFDYDITTGLRCKLNDHFSFPMNLDMAPYTLDQLSQPEQSIEPDTFELTGIIVHSGTADSGHYYSYIRQRPCAKDKQHSWVQFNDSDVTPFDPAQIQDMCFGGADTNWNNLPKFYNAYMLFYQRTSSIVKSEQQFMHTDQFNPLRLGIPPNIKEHIEKENELFLRSYCAQDPAHARFVRQLLECLWENGSQLCSDDHEVEERTLRLALEYLHNISSRTKGQPEMESTAKLIIKYSRRCTTCAASVLQWFTGDQILLESLVRNPFQASRKTVGLILRACCESLHAAASESPDSEIAHIYHSSLEMIVQQMVLAWELVSRTPRAWGEFFYLIADLVDLGVHETIVVLDGNLLILCVELISLHYYDTHDLRAERRLRQRYMWYLSAREKNRVFNHAALIHAFHRMFVRLDLNLWSEGEQRMVRENSAQVGLRLADCEALGLDRSTPQDFDWLKRIIAGRYSSAAADQMVVALAGDRDLAEDVSRALIRGLDHKSMPVAAAFLQPVLLFCQYCGDINAVLELAVRFAESIGTIGLDYGKEYCIATHSMIYLENTTLPRERGFLRETLAQNIQVWAPIMLLSANDATLDVRGNTLEMVNLLLLDRMDDSMDTDAVQYRLYRSRAWQLARAAADYIQTAFLNSNATESQNLQGGHAQQINQVVERCLASAEVENGAQEQQITLIQRVMQEFKARADQAVETLSPEWQESSEMDALSEEFDDLVSP